MSPRTGRPTDNPRPNKLSIRISNEDKEIFFSRYREKQFFHKIHMLKQKDKEVIL